MATRHQYGDNLVADDDMTDFSGDSVVSLLTYGKLCPQTEEGCSTGHLVWGGSWVAKLASKGPDFDLAMDRLKTTQLVQNGPSCTLPTAEVSHMDTRSLSCTCHLLEYQLHF